MNVNFSVYRYIMIPANRGKDSKEQGMALKGTGGSGELSNKEKLMLEPPFTMFKK